MDGISQDSDYIGNHVNCLALINLNLVEKIAGQNT
jgi:hypothetical protein